MKNDKLSRQDDAFHASGVMDLICEDFSYERVLKAKSQTIHFINEQVALFSEQI